MNGNYWRSGADDGRPEEGLNEVGEAPPPYKPDEDEQTNGGPAVPPPAHTREEAGLKPPDYDEVHVTPVQGRGSSGASE